MRGSLNVTMIATEWWHQDGRSQPVAYLALPAVVGTTSQLLNRSVADLGGLQAGVLFLAGALLTILLRTWSWSEDAAQDVDEVVEGHFSNAELRRQLRERLDAIRRLQVSVAWAVLVTLVLAVVLVAASTGPSGSDADVDFTHATAALAGIGTHLVIVLTATVNRTVILTRATVSHNRRRLKN